MANKSMYERQFTSDYGYSRDVNNSDIPLNTQRDGSTLHNVTSLNNDPTVENELAGRFNVPSKNAALKSSVAKVSPLSVQGSGNSSLYGATPSADKQYDQYSKDFQ